MNAEPRRPRVGAALFAVLAAGCAVVGPAALPPGADEASVRATMGLPTAVHAIADGARRLEYASGPFGHSTYMFDFDASGVPLRAGNVLTEANFASIQPGLDRAGLRERLGPPSRIWSVRYRNQTVWSYRYVNPFCKLFHVGITPQGRVEDTSYGPDPLCDDDDRPRRR